MANTRELYGRMKSIRDTMKITNAMYMISSTKMRKAKKAQEGNSAYFNELKSMYDFIVPNFPNLNNKYLDERKDKTGQNRTRLVVVITADKGLAGAYNHNVIRVAESLLNDEVNSKLLVVGEIGKQYFATRKMRTDEKLELALTNPNLATAINVSEGIIEEFLSGEVDEVYIVYTGMKNSITSAAKFMKILPLSGGLYLDEEELDRFEAPEIKFEPSPNEVLNNIIPNMVAGHIYSALVESYCSEQNDRMMAMDSANKNADAMLRELSIEFNRVRQAMITQEITEVIAGAKAQKKKKARKEAQRA